MALSMKYNFQFNSKVQSGIMQSIKLITREASERISNYAFQYATQIGRPNVIVVHKATIMFAFF